IAKGIAWYALLAIPGGYLIAVGTRRRGGMANPAAVPLGLFILVVLQFAAVPVENAISRPIEAETGWVGLQPTRDPGARKPLFRLFRTAPLQQPAPPTWAYLLFENHPTAAQRIAMTEAWRERYATSSAQSP